MPAISDIAHVIQLAIAPVFLLTGVGTILNVLTHRLSRIIDRRRVLEALEEAGGATNAAGRPQEMAMLARRAQIVSRAIGLATICALLVCGVIVALFFGAFLELDVSSMIVLLFISAMLAFLGALLAFLREIVLATASLRR